MKTPTTFDRATEQLVDGAVETADLVADTLVDAAHSAVDVAADVIGDSGEALAALSATSVARRLKQPRTLVALLAMTLVGIWLYRRFVEHDDPADKPN